jgi:hypothetical protein
LEASKGPLNWIYRELLLVRLELLLRRRRKQAQEALLFRGHAKMLIIQRTREERGGLESHI